MYSLASIAQAQNSFNVIVKDRVEKEILERFKVSAWLKNAKDRKIFLSFAFNCLLKKPYSAAEVRINWIEKLF